MAGISGEQRLRTQLYLQSSRVARDSKVVETQAILNLKMVQSVNCYCLEMILWILLNCTRLIVLLFWDFANENPKNRRLQEKCKIYVPHHIQNDTEDLNNANDSDCADN